MFEFFKKQKLSVATEPIQIPQMGEIKASKFNTPDFTDPYCPEVKGSYGYIFGDRNLYPQQLLKFYASSPIHASCINFKALLTFGQGFTYSNKNATLNERITAQQFEFFLNKMGTGLVNDYFIHNRFYVEVTWNNDFTKIIKMKRLPAEMIRIAEVNNQMESIKFNYCFDWKQVGRFGVIAYPKFDTENKKDKVQVYEYQEDIPGKKLYTLPSYRSCLDWVSLDADMGIFHRNNINNSLNPSLIVQFPSVPDTDEKKEQVRQNFVNSFGGAANAGRAIITFSPEKESMPVITQMDAQKLDKSFLALTDQLQRQILFSHNINPDLLGLKTPGSLGSNAGQLDALKAQFLASVITPAKSKILAELNCLASLNGLSSFDLVDGENLI